MRFLVLRPEPGASATAARIAALGHEAIVAPLFRIVPQQWDAPDAGAYDALLLTSANAVRQAGQGLSRLATLPVFAVGEATAAAARDAGLDVAAIGSADVGALLVEAAAAGIRRPLHLVGAEHRDVTHPDLLIAKMIVYRAEPVDALPATALDALQSDAIVLLHSPRAGRLFADLLDRAGGIRATVRVAAISVPAAEAAGDGWQKRAIATLPNDDALLAAGVSLCKTGSH